MSRMISEGNYQKIFDLKDNDWCKLIEAAKTDQFVKLFLDSIMRTTPAHVFLEICNKIGVFKAYNISLSDSLFYAAIPNGDFKISMRAFDHINNSTMMDFSIFVRVIRK